MSDIWTCKLSTANDSSGQEFLAVLAWLLTGPSMTHKVGVGHTSAMPADEEVSAPHGYMKEPSHMPWGSSCASNTMAYPSTQTYLQC